MTDGTLLQNDGPAAQALDRIHIMAHEQYGSSLPRDFAHLAEALPLKGGIADREHFVDDEDFRLEVCRHRESKPHIHAA